ncbi:MAG TPA: tripartite tricarboxylate transporter substrate binding protein [Bordetella sp.]
MLRPLPPGGETVEIRRRQFIARGLALAAAPLAPRAALSATDADGYPSHPMRLVIPFAPGGGTDIIGREIAHQLSLAWKQPVIVENRAGGNGTIGLANVANSPADGYSLSMVTASASVNVTLQGRTLPYSLIDGFAPITQVTSQPYLLVVSPALGVKSVQELLDLGRKRATPLTFGSSGIGGLSHLSGALFSSLSKVPMTHVPYKGGAPAMADVASRQIDMLFSTQIEANGLIQGGMLQALAVTTARRAAASPNLPTMQEAGVAGYEVAGWYGLLAPAHTPPEIVAKLNTEVNRVLTLGDVRQKIHADGSEPAGSTSAQFAAHIRSEVGRWRALIAQLNIPTQ